MRQAYAPQLVASKLTKDQAVAYHTLADSEILTPLREAVIEGRPVAVANTPANVIPDRHTGALNEARFMSPNERRDVLSGSGVAALQKRTRAVKGQIASIRNGHPPHKGGQSRREHARASQTGERQWLTQQRLRE